MKPVEAGAEEGALPWLAGKPYWRTMTGWSPPAAALVPCPETPPPPRLVRSLLEKTLSLMFGMHTCEIPACFIAGEHSWLAVWYGHLQG